MLWRTIDGYTRYEVSETGLIRNKRREKNIKGTVIQGYVMVCLYPDDQSKKPRTFRLHRLIATLFCPNPENYNVVNHKDGNPINNTAKNLEWTTPRENTRHAVKIGKLIPNNERAIRRICPDSGETVEYKSIRDAFKANKDIVKYDNYIITACSGKQKTTNQNKREKLE